MAATSSDKHTEHLAKLRDELRVATEQLDALEADYAQALGDPDMIQEDRDSLRTLLEGARGTLEQATAALERVESGSYGTCVKCGQPIPQARLDALPDVTTCVNCS